MSNSVITLNWLQQMEMAARVAGDKSKVLNTLSYRNGQAIVIDALSPDWYERKDGQIKTRSTGERVRLAHPIVRGDQELGYSDSYTYNSEGKRVRHVEGQRVLNRKFNDSAVQMFSEWLEKMTEIPAKHVLYWHAAYAVNTRFALESDMLFGMARKQLGIEDNEKLRFFIEHQRCGRGLRSPEFLASLWENHVKGKEEEEEEEAPKTALAVAFEGNGQAA